MINETKPVALNVTTLIIIIVMAIYVFRIYIFSLSSFQFGNYDDDDDGDDISVNDNHDDNNKKDKNSKDNRRQYILNNLSVFTISASNNNNNINNSESQDDNSGHDAPQKQQQLQNDLSCHKEKGNQSSSSPCMICLDDFNVGDDVCHSRYPQCSHMFHKTCLLTWLDHSDECPCCRWNFLRSSTENILKEKTNVNVVSIGVEAHGSDDDGQGSPLSLIVSGEDNHLSSSAMRDNDINHVVDGV